MDPYLKLLAALRGRTRWILGILAALSVTAMLMAFNRYDRIYRENDVRNAFLRSDARDRYKAEAQLAYFVAALSEGPATRPTLVLVPLGSMPDVRWDVHLAVSAAMPPETYRLAGYDVSLVVFVGAALVMPSVLLLLLVGTLYQMTQLHRKLAASAGPGTEVQQRLNSLWFDRVTERYLDGWRRHAWLGGLVVLLLALLPGTFVGIRSETRLDPYVAVDSAGRLYPPAADPNHAILAPFTGQHGARVFLLMLPNLVVWGALMWVALRRVPLRGQVEDEGEAAT